MSDQDAPQGDPAPQNDPKADEPLGEGGIKALNAEREARAAAEAAAKDLQKQIDVLNQRLSTTKDDSPEWEQKINALQTKLDGEIEARTKAEKKAAEIERAQYGIDKGLPPALAKKLTGATPEELDAEIDELLPHIGSSGGPKPNPQQGNPSQGRGASLSAGRALYESSKTQ